MINLKNKTRHIIMLLMCILVTSAVSAQVVEVTGTVKDPAGEVLPGVNVIEVGTKNIELTDGNGNYTISVPMGAKLEFSYMGFKNVVMDVTKAKIDVTLEEDAAMLDATVVTAMGISREKKSLGYTVQSVKADELAMSPENNLVRALSGKTAGVFISGGSSGMGGSSNIVIRGNTSLSGNNLPLIVVDNVPMYNDEVQTQSFWDGNNSKGKVDWGDPISKFNMDDIEELSILKGAAATALYGSRAGNGVIIIKTKRGSSNQGKFIGIDYSLNLVNSTAASLPTFQQEYGAGYNGIYEYTGDRNNPSNTENTWSSWGPRFNENLYLPQFGAPIVNGKITSIPWQAHPDNLKNFLQNGVLLENSLGVRLSGEKTYGRISFKNSEETGIVQNTDETRNNINANISSKLTEKWTMDFTANYTESASDNRVSGYGDGIVQNLMRMPSNFDMILVESLPYKFEDGSQNKFSGIENPFWQLNENFNSYARKNLMGSISLRYAFRDWLTASISARKNWSDAEYRSFTEIDTYLNSDGNYSNDGAYSISRDSYDANEFNLALNGDIDLFQGDLNLQYHAGAEYRENSSSNWDASINELAMPDIASFVNALGTKNVSHYISSEVATSVYGLVSLGYKNYLFLDVTGRNDWTSTLATNNWSYFYPSASLAFVFTEALGLDKKIFPYGKLRASWAMVGSATGPYQLDGTWSIAGTNWGSNQLAGYTGTLPNTNLKPQMTESLEFGLDFALFNRRLAFDLSYYKTNTRNQIVSVGVPRPSGYSYAKINSGDLENKGWELMMTVQPIKTKDLLWEVTLNGSTNKSTLVELHDQVKFIRTGWGGLEMRVTEGSEYGDIYGYSFVKNDAGEIIVQGDGKPYRSEEYPNMNWDQYLGNASPKWLAGASSRLRYKDLSLSFTFSSRFGGVVYSMSNATNMSMGLLEETAGLNDKGVDKRLPVAVGGGVRFDGVLEVKNEKGEVVGYEENDVYVEAQDYYSHLAGLHEAHLFKADYIKLQEVSLSYRLPLSVVKRLKFVDDIQVSVVGYNLATLLSYIPNVDPEVSLGRHNAGLGMESGALPSERKIGFKLNLKF